MSATPASHPAWKIWENPFFLRYCRSRLRLRGLGISLLVTALIAGFIVALCTSIGVRGQLDPVDAARPGIIALLVFQSLILFVLGTAQVAGGMTAERDEGVIDYQRLIPMTPLAKTLGYLFGLPAREYAMFLATLPFTAWLLWQGGVDWHVWLPLYLILFSTTLLYHFTGLLTGTVVRNRRWAFIVSIGLVFALYTVLPQLAKFGLVFFKYLTITPVFMECLPGLLPRGAGAALKAGYAFAPSVKFFGLDFSEAVFTVFSQGGCILTFAVMLCRKWRRAEAHLLGKAWAAGFFAWIQLILLGNALPLIAPGMIFPSRALERFVRTASAPDPQPVEAVTMSGIYGIATLILLLLLGGMITPTRETQVRGWRRARKLGQPALPPLADAATASGCMLVMALTGAAGWFLFTRGLVESQWFPGHQVPTTVLGYFAAVLIACGLAFQALLETSGARAVGLAVILAGIVPLMIGAVLGIISERLAAASLWMSGMSPASMPFYASSSLLSLSKLPAPAADAVPRAFHFWLLALLLTAVRLLFLLHCTRREIAAKALNQP